MIGPARPHSGREPVHLDRGTPGRSADAEYRRRRALDAQRRRERWGVLARVAELVGGERQSTRAWSTGATGERRVAAELERALGDRGIVLHDRRVPRGRGNIDHLVVAPCGVWVVDAKRYHGQVERRNVGEWFRSDVRLYVGRRDRTDAIEGVRRQRDVVGRVLDQDFGDDAPPLHAAICLVGAEWPLLARPFCLEGVWVARPRLLGRRLLAPALLERHRVQEVASRLAGRFPVR